ncbi:MAG: cohesin domain-containing protein, partial [Acutalibacteraceae bacterium]|nr:cohesin domain-containing protein [Acutalibacteraceae bacterium]
TEPVTEPETETPAEPTTETPAEPTTETPAEPTTETPAEPTTEFVKPELVSEAEFAPYDAEMFNIVVDEVTGKAGETVDVNITINNNPGIWAGALFLAYDPAVINPVEIPDPTGGDYNVVPYSNVMEGFVADNGYPVDYTVDGYNFKMIAVSVNNPMNFNNITTNGVLATVTFKIAEGVEADDFSNIVFVNFAESKFNNNAGQKYEFAIKEGKVTVLGEPTQPETTTEAPVEPTTEAPVEPTTVAPVVPATTTAAAEVETPDATTVAPEATTAANGGNSSTPSDDVPTGAAAAPFAALALAAGAAFVAFKARKK